MVYIVMGVAGAGKSTIASMLGERLRLPWYDADSYHSLSNVEKMRGGIPLTDEDRIPWLESLAQEIAMWENEGGAVLACSALKEKYRRILQQKNVRFIYLRGTRDVILKRMESRPGHYFPPSLLDTQFEALEEPRDAIIVSIELSPEEICNAIVNRCNYCKSQ